MTHRRGTVAVAAVALVAACLALAEGCQDATQIVVRVSTNLNCASPAPFFEGGHIAVYRDKTLLDGSEATLTKDLCKSGGPIGTLTVVPGPAGDGAIVRVSAAAWLGAAVKDAKAKNARECFGLVGAPDCVVSTRSLRFVSHRSLEIPIFLDSACAGVMCPEKMTCGPGGKCIGEAVEEDAGAPPQEAGVDAALVPMVAQKIWAGGNGTCALLDDGKTVACWGDSTQSQFGVTAAVPPTIVAKLADAREIALGIDHLCAILPGTTNKFDLRCFGSNKSLQLGIDGNITENQLLAGGLNRWTGIIAAGANHTCAVKHVNLSNLPDPPFCWGRAQEGQVDGLTDTATKQPTVDVVGTPVFQLAAGDDFSCALTEESCGIKQCDSVVCWGSNVNGQIAQATKGAQYYPPIRLDSALLVKATAIAAGARHMLALRKKDPNDGTSPNVVVGWGDGSGGQLGAGTTAPITPTPITVSELGAADAVAAGNTHSCVIQKSSVVCIGSLSAITLTAMDDDGGATSIVSGRNHMCALTAKKHVFCWGEGKLMQLGGAAGPDITQIYEPR